MSGCSRGSRGRGSWFGVGRSRGNVQKVSSGGVYRALPTRCAFYPKDARTYGCSGNGGRPVRPGGTVDRVTRTSDGKAGGFRRGTNRTPSWRSVTTRPSQRRATRSPCPRTRPRRRAARRGRRSPARPLPATTAAPRAAPSACAPVSPIIARSPRSSGSTAAAAPMQRAASAAAGPLRSSPGAPSASTAAAARPGPYVHEVHEVRGPAITTPARSLSTGRSLSSAPATSPAAEIPNNFTAPLVTSPPAARPDAHGTPPRVTGPGHVVVRPADPRGEHGERGGGARTRRPARRPRPRPRARHAGPAYNSTVRPA